MPVIIIQKSVYLPKATLDMESMTKSQLAGICTHMQINCTKNYSCLCVLSLLHAEKHVTLKCVPTTHFHVFFPLYFFNRVVRCYLVLRATGLQIKKSGVNFQYNDTTTTLYLVETFFF